MNLQFAKLRALTGICVLLLVAGGAARAQKSENRLPAADERQIVAALLNDKFKTSPETIIHLSTAHLSEEILKDFPPVKNKTVKLVSAQKAEEKELCAYEFGEFQHIDKFVSVSFGNCREGLAYDFVRDADGWKGVGLTITRELFY